MEKIILKLYILDNFPKSKNTEKDLKELIQDIPEEMVDYEVIDLHLHPDKAEEEKILATPTLIRVSPLPKKKLVGSFADKDRVLNELGIKKYIKRND